MRRILHVVLIGMVFVVSVLVGTVVSAISDPTPSLAQLKNRGFFIDQLIQIVKAS